jgi:hypothetical protein
MNVRKGEMVRVLTAQISAPSSAALVQWKFGCIEYLSISEILKYEERLKLTILCKTAIDRLCKAAQSRMRLLCIVHSRMRHRAAFISLSIMYPNFAYSPLKAVIVDSSIRWEEGVWKVACFGSITAIAAQRLWRSQIMTSKMIHVVFDKGLNILHST